MTNDAHSTPEPSPGETLDQQIRAHQSAKARALSSFMDKVPYRQHTDPVTGKTYIDFQVEDVVKALNPEKT